MYKWYKKCMKCGVELNKQNFGGGHKYGNEHGPNKWMIIEAVCKLHQPMFESLRSDRIRK